MKELLLGATAMGAFCISLFFLRFWRSSRDSFHLLFAAAFLLLAVQRVLVALLEDTTEALPGAYLLRLAAYLLIITAVVGKNRRPPEPPARR